MKLQGIKDKVIVEVIKEELKTAGGIIIPESARHLPQKMGRVISVGEEVKEIKEEDIIIFHQMGGQVVLLNNVEYKVLMNNEIYAVIKE